MPVITAATFVLVSLVLILMAFDVAAALWARTRASP